MTTTQDSVAAIQRQSTFDVVGMDGMAIAVVLVGERTNPLLKNSLPSSSVGPGQDLRQIVTEIDDAMFSEPFVVDRPGGSAMPKYSKITFCSFCLFGLWGRSREDRRGGSGLIDRLLQESALR